MLVAARLGGFEEDVSSVLGPLVGTQKVNQFITSFKTRIRSEAEAGARRAIPDIRTEVEDAAKASVKPYVMVALGLGATAVVLSGIVWWKSRGRSRKQGR